MNERTQQAYLSILQEELILATGCTEPIAIAYAAAELRELLGCRPERVRAEVSGNILKNVKSAVVPNTGGLKGIESAIAAGIAAGIICTSIIFYSIKDLIPTWQNPKNKPKI